MTCCKLFLSVFLSATILPSLCAFAQFGTAGRGNLRVSVVYTDGGSVPAQTRVQLMGGASNNPIAQQFTNDRGEAEFTQLSAGNYHVVVRGEGLEDADSGIFEVDARKGSQSISVTVRRTGEDTHTDKSAAPSVSINELKVPGNAKSQFDKASQLMAKADWTGAIGRLNQAIALYPAYTGAYNNLAVAYANLSDWNHEREALQKATALDDHFVPAFVNLARLEMRERNYQAAETLLGKASTIDPSNAQTLTLLCQNQLLDKHYDEAIASAHKVHAMPHEAFAVVHYMAARAFQHESRTSDAITEFKILLQEEPSGARADAVRKELADLESKTH